MNFFMIYYLLLFKIIYFIVYSEWYNRKRYMKYLIFKKNFFIFNEYDIIVNFV